MNKSNALNLRNPTWFSSPLFLKCATTLCCPLSLQGETQPLKNRKEIEWGKNFSIVMESSLPSTGMRSYKIV